MMETGLRAIEGRQVICSVAGTRLGFQKEVEG